ncbi:expressed unknown protein [Seminavis robusta]|uniref:Uncharacterized protein n=1 Tax=Seminavis robusta TaxID=568900 RepID=A0A9N8H3G6_9STRA|nr:expressed unknown protein [Seminavis robusta]|eukprot:Sro26_g017580.1 n/a (405) ;mRNA; f:64726-66025
MISLLVAPLLLLGSTHGLVVIPETRRQLGTMTLSSSLSSHDANIPSDEMIRRDIESMREEAKERLQSLSAQMDDIIRKHEEEHPQPKESSFLDSSAFERAELPIVDVENLRLHNQQTRSIEEEFVVVSPPSYVSDSSLLHDTRWKVVIQVGGKGGNTDEKPLLIHLVMDFTADTLNDNDDLLRSGFSTSEAKTLRIKESWIGASSWTEGRQRDVQIKATGGWKVLPGQGPKGIDILRFYIDVEDEICHDKENSSLRCPAQRVYCTSGFFSMGHHNESEAFKDYLRGELNRLVEKYEDLTSEGENDERLFSLDGVKRAKKMIDLRKQIKTTNERITQARIRDPEKSMLRLSRRGDIGVTKEGQVCYKADANGASAEYLVLGRMEMASINKPIIESPPTSADTLRP